MNWINVMEELPPVMEEVLVWVDGHRGPAWRNNHALVAYRDEKGRWFEERHHNYEPLVGVTKWTRIEIPEN